MKVITAKGVFNGFYEWGPGWTDPAAAERWREFWDGFDNKRWCYWTHFRDGADSVVSTDFLVGVGGSVHLHPMDFTLLYRRICSTKVCLENGEWAEKFGEVDELKEICEKCAEFVGGSFELREMKVHEI